ncbi:hypothetical protein NDU88_001395 [Pleurodeles waltl]|uniref:Uncharacterized protein n=1 Tax=Pleurodeles waltl TaxID=8319 RepID=A0AAV7V7P5_PLEWA|nr:hypothetical protein NDU88_001395 [Pleurodeles waltl]
MASVLNYQEPLDAGSAPGGECCWPPEESPYHPLKRSSSASLSQVREEPEDDVRKCGYLRKHKHGHKRFFVLRAASARGPARLEYYDSEKKFRGGGGLRSPPPKRAIPLYQCFTVSRRADAKHRHLVALYTKDEYFAMAAESEQEQESWYQALSLLMGESKGASVGEADEELLQEADGALRPGAVFKEVWQVHVKPKGLGQTKNLAGVYRLCLSSKMVHLVRLNSDVPCLHLLLMNIRRCGHSENFFFIEVGRSSSVGPGEMWMQVDDSVVAQSMHETFLDTMKALKAFADFRPRSKSQSSGSNPISFISSRRTLGNLPPSQTGLQRRSRTESLAGTPPTSKGSSAYRFRTSSEGEGTMTRPFRSVTGSLIHLNTARMNLSRQEGTGRYVRAPFTSSYHTRSASLPVSHFPATTSPISVCSSSGHGSASETLTRPSSSSVCGSPSDGGFISSDEYGSSPVDFRYFRVRSNTPDSLGNTPPIREENCLSDYMSMSKQQSDSSSRDDYMEADKCFRKRTHSLTKPASISAQQKTAQSASASEEVHLDCQPSTDSTLKENHHPLSTVKPNYSCNQSANKSSDDGYMPMMPGVASTTPSNGDYLPMAPKNGSAPKQILKSWPSSQVDSRGYMVMIPTAASPSPVQSPVTGAVSKGGHVVNGEYMDMTCGNPGAPKQLTDSQVSHPSTVSKGFSSYFSLPRSFKALAKHTNDVSEYVPMSSPGKLLQLGADRSENRLVNGTHTTVSKPLNDTSEQHHRATRPTRLSLETRDSNNILQMCDGVFAAEPSSPGEYINIDFTEKASNTPYSMSAEGSPSSLGSSYEHRQSPLSDYMSVDLDVQSPKAAELSNSLTDISVYQSPSLTRTQPSADYASLPCGTACVSSATNRSDDYAEMTFNMAMTPPRPFAAESTNSSKIHSPSSIVNRLCIVDRLRGSGDFSVPEPCSEAAIGPKVIRVDPQGRRRHSSETFSSAATVATSTSLFTESSKRPSSASFDNVWLKPDEGACDLHESNMSRNSSAGFQNGLNYIALNVHDTSLDRVSATTSPNCHLQNGTRDLDNGAYVSIDFSRTDGLKCTSTRKGD